MNSYFPHDSNARNSDRLLPVRMKYGAEGYGIYFMLLERLREETDYTSIKDYNILAFDLRVDAGKLKSIIEDFGLFAFTVDGECFYSESFKKRMEIKDAKSKKLSEAGKQGAKKRWNNGNQEGKPKGSDSHPITKPSLEDGKKRKVKETKVKETKEESQTSHKYSSEHLRIAEMLKNNLSTDFKKEMEKVNIDKWADVIRLMEERDGLTIEAVEYVVKWLPTNNFWFGNIRSTNKLREQFEKLKHEIKKEKQGGYQRQPVRQETLPDWVDNPVPEKKLSAEKQLELEKQLAETLGITLEELRKRREEGN